MFDNFSRADGCPTHAIYTMSGHDVKWNLRKIQKLNTKACPPEAWQAGSRLHRERADSSTNRVEYQTKWGGKEAG